MTSSHLLKQFLIVLVSAQMTTVIAAPCVDATKLDTLKREELAYLLNKIPPAFKHGVEDSEITIDVQSAEADRCAVKLTVNFPQRDLDEAGKILFTDPAKRIMLASQGYSIPESSPASALFQVDPDSFKIRHEDTLQLAPLGKLRASLELMYAAISQSRAGAVTEAANNTQPWLPAFADIQINACISQQKSSADSSNACACKIKTLSQHYSQREIEYQYYVKSNPYAAATGAGKSFEGVEKKANQDCNLF